MGEDTMNLGELMQMHFVRKVQNPEVAAAHDNQPSLARAVGQIEMQYKNATRKIIDPCADDPAIVRRIKHTMRKREKMMEWFARSGVSRADILAGISREEISLRVAAAELRNREEGFAPEMFAPIPPPTHPPSMPTHPVVDSWAIRA
jgi:hypothetical protein